MTGTMRAVVKTAGASGAIELRTVPIPQIGPRDILVRVKAAAVCGTDVHIRHWNAWAQARMSPPVVIGHEFSGEVVEVGRDVTSVKVGDRVSSESHIACNNCQVCREGNRHVCPNTQRAALAKQLGADVVIDPISQDPVAAVRALTDGYGPHVAVDFSGSVAGLTSAMQYLRPEGQLTCVALPDKPVSVSISDFGYRGCSIRGIAGRRMFENWQEMRGMLQRGLDLSPIITHVLPLEAFEKGLDMTEQGTCTKCILIP